MFSISSTAIVDQDSAIMTIGFTEISFCSGKRKKKKLDKTCCSVLNYINFDNKLLSTNLPYLDGSRLSVASRHSELHFSNGLLVVVTLCKSG